VSLEVHILSLLVRPHVLKTMTILIEIASGFSR